MVELAKILDLDWVFDKASSIMREADNFHCQSEKTVLLPKIDAEFVSGLISVIIPTYNRRALVQEALASVVEQTWQNIEIIVVDDGSTDGTFERLNTWKNDNPNVALTLLYQVNSGVATARNNGLAHAKGEFLYMLDSDDLIFPDALETLVKSLLAGDCPYSLANIHSSNEKGRILAGDNSGIPTQSEQDILSNQWMTHAALYRRSTLTASELFNNSLIVGEDTEFRWRVVAKTGLGSSTSQYIGLRRQHSFGHLSFNRTDLQCLKHSLQAQLAFRKWLNSEGMQMLKIDIRQHIALFGMVIRFGAAGDWSSKDDARLLHKISTVQPTRRLTFLDAIGTPNWRPYYLPLLAIFNWANGIRDIYRSVMKRRHAGYQRTALVAKSQKIP